MAITPDVRAVLDAARRVVEVLPPEGFDETDLVTASNLPADVVRRAVLLLDLLGVVVEDGSGHRGIVATPPQDWNPRDHVGFLAERGQEYEAAEALVAWREGLDWPASGHVVLDAVDRILEVLPPEGCSLGDLAARAGLSRPQVVGVVEGLRYLGAFADWVRPREAGDVAEAP